MSCNATPLTAVCFIAQAIDASEPGTGKDRLYLNVTDMTGATTLLHISTDLDNNVAPVPISTGNLKTHTTSCN